MKYTGNDIEKQYEIIPIGQAKDIRGKEFKRLRVIERVKDSRKGVFWLCKCKCGNYKVARGSSLTSGDTTSCGCRLAEKLAPHDITGQKFGRLTAVEITNKRSKSGDAYWKCLCDCGNYTTVPKSRVSSGNVKSCGCLVGELASERLKAWTPEERRGRASKMGTKHPRKNKKTIQENEDLLAEVQRLRMENEYLKKLNALVQEREKSEKKTK